MPKEKHIIANTYKGKFAIPLIRVAQNRADYYASEDGFLVGSSDYKEEVDFVMNDTFEGIDWILNNTNFKDWEGIAVLIGDGDATKADFWNDSSFFEIEEIDISEFSAEKSKDNTSNGWIRCSDRLPEPEHDILKVLVYHNREIKTLHFNKIHECWDDASGDDYYCDIDAVTHWQPLPEPPND